MAHPNSGNNAGQPRFAPCETSGLRAKPCMSGRGAWRLGSKVAPSGLGIQILRVHSPQGEARDDCADPIAVTRGSVEIPRAHRCTDHHTDETPRRDGGDSVHILLRCDLDDIHSENATFPAQSVD